MRHKMKLGPFSVSVRVGGARTVEKGTNLTEARAAPNRHPAALGSANLRLF